VVEVVQLGPAARLAEVVLSVVLLLEVLLSVAAAWVAILLVAARLEERPWMVGLWAVVRLLRFRSLLKPAQRLQP
jgi:hypothetical protein